MFISYVLRLRPESVAGGRFLGEVEAVTTGQRFAVGSFDQLIAVVLETIVGEREAAWDVRSRQAVDL